MPLSSDANIKTLTFKWSMQDGGTKTACTSASKYDFVPSSTWGIDCDIAVLRVDLVSNPSANATNATNLYNNTVTLYLTPRGGNGATQTVSFGTATPGNVVSGADATSGSGACTSGTCKAVLTMPDNTTTYYARITAMYKDSKTVIVSGVNDNGTAKFYGAQAVVDVTGKDQDELRRVQARVALTGSNDTLPLGALAGTNGICKQFTVLPTDNVDPTDASCN
jgi:hypothetical protein